MCTAFPYWWFSVQRLLEVIHAIISAGGFVAGPRTLRPERLRWLTTSAVNRQAFRIEASALNQCGAGGRHHCDAHRQRHAGSGHRAIWSSGRSARKTQDAAFPSRALRPFLFLKILIGVKSGRNDTLRIIQTGKRGPG